MKARYIESLYNGAETTIPVAIRHDIGQICSAAIRVDNRKNTNADLSESFQRSGWQSQVTHAGNQGRMDFMRDRVGVEVQLRQGTNVLYNLLKFELDFRDKMLKAGVIITYDWRSVPIVGTDGQDASIQKLSDFMVAFVETAIVSIKASRCGR